MRPLCDTFTSAHTVNRATTRQDGAVSRDDLLEACPSTTRSFRTHGPIDAPRQRPLVTTGIARFATDCNGRRNTGAKDTTSSYRITKNARKSQGGNVRA